MPRCQLRESTNAMNSRVLNHSLQGPKGEGSAPSSPRPRPPPPSCCSSALNLVQLPSLQGQLLSDCTGIWTLGLPLLCSLTGYHLTPRTTSKQPPAKRWQPETRPRNRDVRAPGAAPGTGAACSGWFPEGRRFRKPPWC